MKSIRSFRTAVLATAAAVLAVSSASALEATVVSSKGKAEFQKSEGAEWAPLTAGETLSKGAVISTGFKSELILKIRDSVITVAPLTRMTLEQLAEKPHKDETRVFLDTGSIKSNVKHTEDRRTGFTVRSPVATASVRGTTIDVGVGFQKTAVTCTEGTAVTVPTTGSTTAQLSTDKEDSAAEQLPGDGNTVNDIAPGAGAGAATLSAGQTTSYSDEGQVTAQTSAARTSTTLAAAPVNAGKTEAETMGGTTDTAAAQANNERTSTTASVTVTCTLVSK